MFNNFHRFVIHQFLTLITLDLIYNQAITTVRLRDEFKVNLVLNPDKSTYKELFTLIQQYANFQDIRQDIDGINSVLNNAGYSQSEKSIVIGKLREFGFLK
jgi:hypothetical protein